MLCNAGHLLPLPNKSGIPVRPLRTTGLGSIAFHVNTGTESVHSFVTFSYGRPHLDDESVKVVLSEDGDGVVPAATVLGEVELDREWGVPLTRLLGSVK